MKKLTALIVDDEISNIKGLEHKINTLFKEITIINSFQKPEDAIIALQKEQPDILFLDIVMPRINGFELLSQIRNINFEVIFVTAYNEYAIEAFKQNAVDYLLKPIDDDSLINSVNKAIKVIKTNINLEENQKLLNLLTSTAVKRNKIIIPTEKGLSLIPQEEVLHLEGYEGYTKIHLTSNKELISSYNLGKFEKLLNTVFFKCHKSHIVNLERVRHFEKEGYVVLENNIRIPISRSNKKRFLELFK